MAKRAQFGVNLYHKQKPRKRPGRHKKNLNKATKRMKKKKYRGQGRGWQTSLDILYRMYESKERKTNEYIKFK